MLVYAGFDDTDTIDSPRGTGRLVREFARELPVGCSLVGVVRHQLPRLEAIAYTSRNSSACALLAVDPEICSLDALARTAAEYVTASAPKGSDPGVCVAEASLVKSELVDFARRTTGRLSTQAEAMAAVNGARLMGLGGTNDGIIGAAAAVGLTRYGWCGRFIEYGNLRALGRDLRISDLEDTGIRVVCVDRDPLVPLPSDILDAQGWIRPSLWAGEPVLQVVKTGPASWRPAHGKRRRKDDQAA